MTSAGAKRASTLAFVLCLILVEVARIKGPINRDRIARSFQRQHLAEEDHTERDTLLGWVNKPNVSLPDLYAPGASFHTNSQRFRHVGELAAQPPAGKRRVVCSGDSFTMGYGVGDGSPWCAQLAALDTSLETVNMGQGGYALDQTYLWYLRDGAPLHPNVHIVAIITSDLARMLDDVDNGFPKPRLERSDTGLRVVGVPVRNPGLGPGLVRLINLIPALGRFDVLREFPGGGPTWSTRALKDDAALALSRATLQDLAHRDSLAAARLVVVYLPLFDDVNGQTSDNWRRGMRDVASKSGFQFVDLVAELRRVPSDSLDALFLPERAIAFSSAGRHYTPLGNAWVAGELLRLIPGLRE